VCICGLAEVFSPQITKRIGSANRVKFPEGPQVCGFSNVSATVVDLSAVYFFLVICDYVTITSPVAVSLFFLGIFFLSLIFCCYYLLFLSGAEAESKEKHGVWDPKTELTITSPLCPPQSRCTMGNPMPESTSVRD